MVGVESSHVLGVEYEGGIGSEGEGGILRVRWKNGRVSEYMGVPSEIASTVMGSWSVGGALHEMVKPFFKHRYVGDGE